MPSPRTGLPEHAAGPSGRWTWISLSPLGLVLGTLFLAASLTPSLVPRPPLIQGALGGFCLAAGYGIGVALGKLWRWLHLPIPGPGARRYAGFVAMAVCAVSLGLALWWSSGWQNRLRDLMGMPPVDSAGWLTVAAAALGLFVLLLLIVRLFGLSVRSLTRRFSRIVSARVAILAAVGLTALVFWSFGTGVLVSGAMRMADASFMALDGSFEATSPRPTDPLKSGGPGSLLNWEDLGRKGRRMVAAAPDRAEIEHHSRRPAKQPLRVYVGLNSADDPAARARLALDELVRIGAFERANLVIATPTGTGWIDPEGQSALEFLLDGDVATVSVQYSYLTSWIALLAEPEYGLETARAVFATVYNHWKRLPREARPRLYLNGLSLGAFNSDRSHDLFQVIGDPYDGALWVGPPFNSETWGRATRDRNAGSPAWRPSVGDGSVIRFMNAGGSTERTADWGPFRILFLQYPSDAVTFFEPAALWRKPDWMTPPIGPDVSPEFIWMPVVTVLQLAFDVMFAVAPPPGHGHTFAFADYVDAWADLLEPPEWTPADLDRLKRDRSQ